MATVLDPEGDPILDPDGNEIGEGTAPSYASQVLTDNPTAYWPFAGGSYADATGHGHTLSDSIATPTHLTDGPVLAVSDAFTVDNGHGLTVNTPGTLPTDGSRQFSVESWVRGAAFSNQVLFYQDSYLSQRSWHVAGQGGHGRAVASNTGSNTWVEGSGTVFDGTWHHYVVTVDCAADEVKFYIDGVLDVTRTDPQLGDEPNGAPLRLGSGFEGAPAATVDIAHVAIYFNAILPADRVAAHYAARLAPVSLDVIAGRITIHGGDITAPEPQVAPIVDPGHVTVHGGGLSVSAPAGGLYDPFERTDINPPPFGGSYTIVGGWEIVGGQARSTGGGVNALIFDTGFRNVEISATVLAAPTGFPLGAGVVVQWDNGSAHVYVIAGHRLDEFDDPAPDRVEARSRDGTNPSGRGLGGQPELADGLEGGRLRAVLRRYPIEDQSLTVYWNDVEINTVLPGIDAGHGFYDGFAGRCGLYADGVGSLIDDLLIVNPTPNLIDPAALEVHGGAIDVGEPPPVIPTVSAAHLHLHGGALDRTVTPPKVTEAHAALHAGAVNVPLILRVESARIALYSGTVTRHLAQLVLGGRYPIGKSAVSESTGLLDEDGDVLVDENGDVLIFD